MKIARALGIFLLCFSGMCGAADSDIRLIEPNSRNSLWINPGLYSYHFDQNKNFNSINIGFGAEYQFSSVASLTAGVYRNSYYQTSAYVGSYWQPIMVGPIKLGLVAGMFNGYSNTNNGGWFPAALPAVTLEGDLIGLNLIFIPTIPDRISGSMSLQIKFKVLD